MKKGFTLAETLIVLGLIGLVASFTIPTLYSAYQKSVFSARLKKTFNEIDLAIKQINTDESSEFDNFDMPAVDFDTKEIIVNDEEENENAVRANLESGFYSTRGGMKESSSTSGAQYFLENYIKYNKKGSNGEEFFAPQYKNSRGVIFNSDLDDYYCVTTQSDASICMRYSQSYRRMLVIIDLNGPTPPNTTGIDLFSGQMSSDSLIDTDPDIVCGQAQGGGDEAFIKSSSGCLQNAIESNWKIH